MSATLAPAKKIMVVEDESVISLDIRNSLTKLGYTISGVASSGDAALRKIHNHRPDLILMDIHLKGDMTGIEVSQKVKSDFEIPIVYLTANADSSTFKEAQGTDPFGYVLKPFEEKELGIAIEIALNKHQKEQTVRSSESWYATAFQSLSEAVVATDPHGHVVFMNAAAERMIGWALIDVVDQPVTNILSFQRKIQQFDHIAPSKSVNSILGEVLKNNAEVPFPGDAQLLTKSSKCVPVQGKATVLRDALGRTIGSLFIFSQAQEETVPDGEPQLSVNMTTSVKEALSQATLVGGGEETLEKIKPIEKDDVNLTATFTRAFINKQPIALSTDRLIASAGAGGAKLTSRTEGCVVRVSSINNELTAIVTETSAYAQLAGHFLIENSFFPVRRRTNGLCHYQHCDIPKQTLVYRTDGLELWKVWHGKNTPEQPSPGDRIGSEQPSSDRLGYKLSRQNMIVLRRGSWYRIQQFKRVKDDFQIKTAGGEIFVSSEDTIIWGAKT